MKNKLKSILALLLMITLVATNFITVSAAVKKGDLFVQDKMTFKITKTATSSNHGEVSITGYSNKKSTKELNIPSTVKYNKTNYKVTSIDSFTFQKSKFNKVKIPNTIKNIGNSAFRKCINLTSVTVPKNVSLGSLVFRECTSLKSAILSEGITNIPTSTFYGCTNLSTVKIPVTISKIDNFAFSKTNIKEVILPKGLTEIGQDAFSNCKALTSIYISSKVKTVGRYAFKGCTNLIATIPRYSMAEKVLLDDNIKYEYSDESVFLVESIEANVIEDGITYYKVTNNTSTTYYTFSVEYLLLDSTKDQIGGGNASSKLLFKPGDSTVFGIQTKDKTYSDFKLIVIGDTINKTYKDMSRYIDVTLKKESNNYDNNLEITSTSPSKIDYVNIEIIFYKDNKLVYMWGCNVDSFYKGIEKKTIYFPNNLEYNSYATNITAISKK